MNIRNQQFLHSHKYALLISEGMLILMTPKFPQSFRKEENTSGQCTILKHVFAVVFLECFNGISAAHIDDLATDRKDDI